MAITSYVLGHSGGGKSFSMRNLDPSQTTLIKLVNKPLPYRTDNHPATFYTTNVQEILAIMNKSQRPIIVIDDFQYFMSLNYSYTKTSGFDKFNEINKAFLDIVLTAVNHMKPYQRVYILSHILEEDGKTKMKTLGKFIDEKITPEGLVSIVLQTSVENGKNYFLTKNDGNTTVKTPYEMFEMEKIPNDLELVDDAICDYYNIPKTGIQSPQPQQPQVA